MMLFWILAITDLIMVGITWAVYGSSATYRDGMLLGVHLPESVSYKHLTLPTTHAV